MMYGDHGHDGGWGSGSWILMSLMMLVVLALVAWGILLVWRSSSHPHAAATHARADAPGTPGAPATPEAILGERLARGEIEPEEYRTRMEALKPDGP